METDEVMFKIARLEKALATNLERVDKIEKNQQEISQLEGEVEELAPKITEMMPGIQKLENEIEECRLELGPKTSDFLTTKIKASSKIEMEEKQGILIKKKEKMRFIMGEKSDKLQQIKTLKDEISTLKYRIKDMIGEATMDRLKMIGHYSKPRTENLEVR